MENENLVQYEMMFILPPDLGENETSKELDEVRSFITSAGGDIYHEDIWGHQDFAYKIKKYDQGYYAVFNFNFPPENIQELEKALNIHQSILRYLILKVPTNYEVKTLSDYQAEAEKEAAEKKKAREEAEKEKKSSSKPAKKLRAVPKAVEEKKEEEPTPEKKEESEKKLASIIDDPDLNL